MLFLKNKATIQENFYQMSCMKEKLSIYAKKLYPLFPNCYFIRFSLSLLFPSGKTLGFRFFSLNSWVILKIFSASPRIFSILPSNLMKKILIQVFYLIGKPKKLQENFFEYLGILEITISTYLVEIQWILQFNSL